jgi:hypothetical protein
MPPKDPPTITFFLEPIAVLATDASDVPAHHASQKSNRTPT